MKFLNEICSTKDTIVVPIVVFLDNNIYKKKIKKNIELYYKCILSFDHYFHRQVTDTDNNCLNLYT